MGQTGGTLVYVGDGSDSFHWVREWWNQGGNTYRTPAEHLMEALGLSRTPEDGLYSVGEGRVQIIGKHPTVLARDADLSDTYLACVRTLLTEGEPSAALILRRGAYYVTAVMDETPASSPTELKGCYINLYDEQLPVIEDPTLEVGSVGLWYDTARIDKSAPCELIALSGRAEKLVKGQRSLSFVSRSPSEMTVACRIWTKRPPKSIRAGGEELPFEYEPDSETTYFTYPSDGEKISVKVSF